MKPEMKRTGSFRAAVLILAVVAGCAGPEPPLEPPSNTARLARAVEVEAALQEFMGSWERADVELLVASFTPDAVIYDPTPPGEVRGADAIRSFVIDFLQANQQIGVELSDVRVATEGPVGWTTSRYRFVAITDGEERISEGNLTLIFVIQPDESYRVALFHASRLLESPGATDSQ
jgi:ketosteroid isomerase-like protein